jgi:hypothetical protein
MTMVGRHVVRSFGGVLNFVVHRLDEEENPHCLKV